MPGHPRADPALSVQGIVDGAADIFLLVVEAHVDFIEPARLGPAFAEVRPLVDRLPRRTAVAAAGEVAEGIGRHLCGLETELEAVNLAGVAARLGIGRSRKRKHGDRGKRRWPQRVGWAKAP